MATGPISKVEIHAYTNNDFSKKKDAPNSFILPINPESYSRSKKIKEDKRKGHGNQGTNTRYVATEPEELKLEFILDGTDTVEDYYVNYKDKDKSVKRQLELFYDIVYNMNGKIHRPNFLKIHWGKYLTFQCTLSSLDISYQLFESSGDPLRAKISASFLEYLAPKERVARQRKESPDLTHLRQVTSSDRLDLLAFDIYNDTTQVLQVAKANGLTSIRSLRSGAELRFPPIDKTETV